MLLGKKSTTANHYHADLIKHSTDVIDLELYNDSTVVIYDRRGSTRLATDFPAASTKMT